MSGGTISGNTANYDGGGVYTNQTSCSFTMTGGAISDNEAGEEGGGVYLLKGTFTMSGGTISGNSANSSGGGVDMHDDNGQTTVNVSGKAVITGNTVGSAASNVNLYRYNVITVNGVLHEDADIGITRTAMGEFTSGWSTYMSGVAAEDIGKYFTSDSSGIEIIKNDSGELKLQKAPIPVTGVTLNKASTTLTVGDTETLTATLAPDNATNKAVTWKSSDEEVATVDNTGKVTAVDAGEATITVTTADGSKTATCVVTVTIPVTGVTLNKSSINLYLGKSETDTLTATMAPDNATDKTVTWTSSDPTVVEVEDGVVTALKSGAATITATAADGSDKAATCTVNVMEKIDSVTINVVAPVVGDVINGNNFSEDSNQFNIHTKWWNGTEEDITVEAGNSYKMRVVISADSTYYFDSSTTASIKVGDEIITQGVVLSDINTEFDECAVEYTFTFAASTAGSVKIYKDGVAVTTAQSIILPGINEDDATATYTTKVLDQYNQEMSGQAITWSITNATGISVDANGKVTVTKDAAAGDYTLTATCGGKSDSITIKVEKDPVITAVVMLKNSETITTDEIIIPGTGATPVPYGCKIVDQYAQDIGGTVSWSIVDANNQPSDKVTVANGVVTVTAGAAAGNYILTATCNENNSVKGTVTIDVAEKRNQGNFKFGENAVSKIFGDAAFTFAATGAEDGSSVTYESDNTSVATVNASTGEVSIVGAGNATITATASATATHKSATASYTLIVSQKAVAEPTVSGTYPYTGQVQTVVLSGFDSNIMSIVSGNTGTDVDDYEVVIALNSNYKWASDGDGNVTWSITKVASTWSSAPTAKENLIYTNEAKLLVNAGTANGGTMQYKLGENGEWIADIPAATNAGEYTVYYKVKGDSNHSDSAEGNVTVTIAKKQITAPTADSTVFTYNGEAQTYMLATGADYTIGGASVTQTNAGTYTITVTLNDTDNTEWSDETAAAKTYSFVIAKANSAVTNAPTAKTDLKYTGSAQTLVTAGTAANGTMQYKVGNGEWSTDIPTATNAGTHTVYYKVVGNSNYNDVAESNFDVTIAKADITPTVSIDDWIYGQTASDPIVSDNIGNGTVTYSYKVKNADDATYAAAVPTVAGEYTVKATIAETANYNGGSAAANFTIAKADITPTVNMAGWIYGQTASEPAVTGNTGNGTITYAYKVQGAGDETYSAAKPTAAGNYTVKATITETANYNGGSATADFTIEKAEITAPTADSTEFTYNGSAQTYTLATGDACTIGGASVTQTNAGTYTITVTLNDTDNTKWSDGTTDAKNYTFTIAKATATITAKDQSIYIGEDAPALSSPAEDTHYTVTGLIGEDTIDLSGITMAYSEAPDTSAAGTFEITVTGADGGINYDVEYTAGTLTVSNRPVYSNPSYPVVETESEAPDGTVSFSKAQAEKDEIVTVTVTPNKYYSVEKIIVRDEKGEEIEVTRNEDGTYFFKMPAGKVSVEAVYVWENPFVDVSEGTHYIDAVEWALKNGITEGKTETTFEPNSGCTRAQMVTFLWRAAGSPEPKSVDCQFTDVDMDSYYGKAILWAIENGITNGTSDTTFSPDKECSRAQMAAFLCRMADGEAANDESTFVDVKADAYYAEAVQWAVEKGITNGTTATTFSPNVVCTRGQMVTFLYRFLAD